MGNHSKSKSIDIKYTLPSNYNESNFLKLGINPFHTTGLSSETLENQSFLDFFRRYRTRPVTLNKLMFVKMDGFYGLTNISTLNFETTPLLQCFQIAALQGYFLL